MLAIFPIQDWLSIDAGLRREDFMSERINLPADSQNHWKYRLHLNIEDLAREKSFSDKVLGMIKESRRANPEI